MFIAWLLPAAFSLYTIISGGIPFWYDPARDMLSAWSNLHKLTLIGSTSGISGIFYGPYWIWFLSIPVFFSKDPRLTTFVVSFIPYMFFFPIILYQFKRHFDKSILLVLWILFILNFNSYVIFIWNPNNAPLLFLLAIYIILSAIGQGKLKSALKRFFLAGIIIGLVLNIDLSFGAVFVLSSILFLFLNTAFIVKAEFKIKLRQFFSQLGAFLVGIILMFLPFFVFEIKHGFKQTKTALTALVHGGGTATVHGLTKQQIIQSFFSRWGTLLHIPLVLSLIILFILAVIFIVLLLRKRLNLSKPEKIMFLFLLSLAVGCLGLYLSVHNPVWDYHFIGVEILWLLLLGIFLTKVPFIKFIVYGWILIMLITQTIGFAGMLRTSVLATDSLATKELTVKIIAENAKGQAYSVYAYSPSIYIYEYSYLFKWLAGKNIPYDPSMEKREKIVYLILPSAGQSVITDFIHFRTPDNLYKTVKIWSLPDGTSVMKRSLL